jgi:GDP-L-fucose synthase
MSIGKLLITGAGGMVGRNLLAHPAIKRWRICAPSRAELDLADRAATEAYFRNECPDVVLHAAGRVGGIQANIANPVAFLVENMDASRNVIMAARAAGVKNLLNLGSSCMYPRGHSEPLREEQILTGELEPTNEGYAIAKIMAARLCQYIRQQNAEMFYKTLIPCNLYGKYDKFDEESSHLVPAIISKIHHAKARRLKEVVIWGDGQACREFMFAGDFVEALVKALEEPSSLPDLMNIGLGLDHSITTYYEAAAHVIGWTGSFKFDTSRPVGMARKLVDTSRQTSWGWQAQTSLEDGIRETYSYYLREVA